MLTIDIDNIHNFIIPKKIFVWSKVLFNFLHIKKVILSLKIVNESTIKEFNYRYRNINASTNILSFPYFKEKNNINNTFIKYFLGDIIICPIVINRESIKQKKEFNDHWCHIFLHGILHLLGYKHNTKDSQKKMENLEIVILSKLNIKNPYYFDEL